MFYSGINPISVCGVCVCVFNSSNNKKRKYKDNMKNISPPPLPQIDNCWHFVILKALLKFNK